jgi:uncharacterized protein (TIGR01244 family)
VSGRMTPEIEVADAEDLEAGPWRARWWRRLRLVVVAYLVVVVGTNALIYGGLGLARLTAKDRRSTEVVIPSIQNLRKVDERLWVGDQPRLDGYRSLAREAGVKRVINLRTGDGTDPVGDRPEGIAKLGIEYVHLPLHDGHIPNSATVGRFLELVNSAPGPVYAHCGGGVGRSSVMESAYRASKGEDPSLLDQLFLGPLSLEQARFVLKVRPGKPTKGNWIVQSASRVIDFPRPYFSWLARQLG